MRRADRAPGQTSPLPPITVPLHKHWPRLVYSSLDMGAKHHLVLAEHTDTTHINTLIINISPGHRGTLGPSHLKEIAQSNLKLPKGGTGSIFFHKHVPISSSVNNSNAEGRSVAAREGEDRWKMALGATNEGRPCPSFNVSGPARPRPLTRRV